MLQNRSILVNEFISSNPCLVKYVLQLWMKKVWPEFCPFRTYLRVQHNISDIFERFSINSCNKKMKAQETLKKISGYMNVQRVTNDFLIFTLSKTVKYVLQWWMKKVWLEFCHFRNYLRVQYNKSDIFETNHFSRKIN